MTIYYTNLYYTTWLYDMNLYMILYYDTMTYYDILCLYINRSSWNLPNLALDGSKASSVTLLTCCGLRHFAGEETHLVSAGYLGGCGDLGGLYMMIIYDSILMRFWLYNIKSALGIYISYRLIDVWQCLFVSLKQGSWSRVLKSGQALQGAPWPVGELQAQFRTWRLGRLGRIPKETSWGGSFGNSFDGQNPWSSWL